MNNTRLLLTAVLAIVSAGVFAGWEDVGVARQAPASTTRSASVKPAQPRTDSRNAPARPAPRPAPRPVNELSSGAYLLPPDLYSAFLDAPMSMPNHAGITYIASGDADRTKEAFSELIFSGSFFITSFEDVLSGDMTLTFDPALTFFPNDAGVKKMPSMLVQLAADFDWTWRYINGWSFEFGATPGIFADVDGFGGGMFGIPLRGIFYYAFDPSFSVKFGLEFRPGWDQLVMPHAGIAWQPDDMFRIELGVPRTVADIKAGVVDIFGKIEWFNTTYAMSGDKDEPDEITLNEWKLGAGLGFDLGDSWRLVLDAGLMFGREISVEKGSASDSTDVDPAPYFNGALEWSI